jgi:CubicO group peptidase (beta-lactamase class C family)
MMKRSLLFLLLLPGLVNAQTIAQKADELLTAYTNQNKFSGNVLIAKEGKIVFQKAYGYADKDAKRLNTLETEFRAGSLTKMFTSTAILQLAETSRLSLTDPVSKFVPGFADGNKIQILHLLSHTSGIQGSTASPEPTTLSESVKQFKSEHLAFEPGSRFEYNNFNYILLSSIAEKVSGKKLNDLLQSKVLNKAGMKHSGLDYNNRKSTNKAFGYITNPQTIQWERANEGNVALAAGAGALYSTLGDLYKWSAEISRHRIISETSLAKAWKPVQGDYGLGWIVSTQNGRTKIGHTGSIPGFIAYSMKYPKENVSIIFLSNYQDLDGRKLADDLTAVVFNEPYTLPKQKKEIALSKQVLDRYTGDYQLGNGFTITVSVDGNKLYAIAQGDPAKMELTPETDKKFFLKGPETAIEFIEESGAVKYMFVDMQGGKKFTKTK